MNKCKRLELIILRKFAIPLIVTLTLYNNFSSFWEGFLYFGAAFFLNWIVDSTLGEWSIKRGKKLEEKKKIKEKQKRNE